MTHLLQYSDCTVLLIRPSLYLAPAQILHFVRGILMCFVNFSVSGVRLSKQLTVSAGDSQLYVP